MSITIPAPHAGQFKPRLPVPYVINRFAFRIGRAVASFHDDDLRTKGANCFGGGTEVGNGLNRAAPQHFSFRHVRHDDSCHREQVADQRIDSFRRNQRVAAFGAHDRVDYKTLHVVVGQPFSHHFNNCGVHKHPGLHNIGTDVGQATVDLGRHKGRRHRLNCLNSKGIFGHDGSDGRLSENTEPEKHLQISLQPCPAAAVRSSHRQTPANPRNPLTYFIIHHHYLPIVIRSSPTEYRTISGRRS